MLTLENLKQQMWLVKKACVWIPEDESQTFQERCVNIHNFYRCLHNSPIVTGSNGLEDSAQSWADHLSQIGERLPSNTADVGENIYFLFQPGKVASAGDAIIGWYSQYFLYGFNNPGLSPLTEDFTQLVWATTTTIGCGRAVAGSATYIVVHYNPPGNQPDIFQANVKQIKPDTCETRCGVTSYCQGLDPEMSTCMACDGGFSNCNGRCTQYCPKPQGFNGFWREWCDSASSCTCDENFNFFVNPPIFPGAKCV
ncbi:unnamed protein product [Clavelina lepadiformis]|uniref:SCP domain-containing protein n=1 Tax=Clavelina lepadiformis TaxID=159417 RepID=A0ABP0FVC9_CLALP